MRQAFLAPLILGLACLGAMAQAQSSPRIEVAGSAQISVVPDMARLQLGVERRDADAAAALDAMAADMTAVMDRLMAAGIAEKDMQTNGLSLNVELDYAGNGPGRVVGYTARSNLNIAVYDIDKLGETVTAAVADGANQISSLQFDIADRQPHEDAAMRAAVASARAKAELYAEAAGVSLGALILLSENTATQPGPFPMQSRAAFAESAVPIAAGEIEIPASVMLVYAIAD